MTAAQIRATWTDEVRLVVMKKGDDHGFTVLFKREFASIFREVSLIVGDRENALDVTQEAFARLYLHWRKISKYERPGAWVRRVAIRLAVRSRRAKFHGSYDPQSSVSKSSLYPEVIDLGRALQSLPSKLRAAVVLRYLEGLSIKEVADLLNCSEGAVKVRLHRALKILAVELGDEVGNEAH